MSPLAIVKIPSLNAKLGNAGTTHAAQASCPPSCVFKDGGGCYAETGRQGKFVTAKLNDQAELTEATALDVALEEARLLDEADVIPGLPIRLHTVGDCASDETARIVSAAAERWMDRGGGPVWTYTHAWRDVKRESWGRVSVLASCETTEQVFEARSIYGYATAVVVPEFASTGKYEIRGLPLGQDVIPCPAQSLHRSCSDCRLCFDDDRLRRQGLSIAFEVHGIPAAQRSARTALSNPDDPDRRVPSEERIRRIRERYLREDGREPTATEISAEIPDLSMASVYEWLRYLRGEIEHPAQRRRKARAAR